MDNETPTNPDIEWNPTGWETVGEILGIACFLAVCYVVFLFAAAA
jgi:hypothetical protein